MMIETVDAWLIASVIGTVLFGLFLAVWMINIDSDYSRGVKEGAFDIDRQTPRTIFAWLKQGAMFGMIYLILITVVVISLLVKYGGGQ